MPTLDDLRAAFAELEHQAPASLREPVRPSHRRRWATVGLAAACTAAVAVATPLIASSGDGGQQPSGSQSTPSDPFTKSTTVAPAFATALPAPAAGASPDLTYRFTVPDPVAGYTVIPDLITRTYQHASVYGPTDPPGGQVFVFYRGAFDPTEAQHGTPADVDGRPGFFADVRLPGDDGLAEALVWEYADDGWAAVRLGVGFGNPVAKNDPITARERAAAQAQVRTQQVHSNEVLIATTTRAAHDALRSPIRIADGTGYVDSMAGAAGTSGSLVLVQGATTWDLGWSPSTLSPSDKPDTSTTEIAGRQWIVYHDRTSGSATALGLVADGWGMTVTPSGGVTLAQMRQFAAGLGIAPDPSNADSWFDAGANLP